MPAPKVWGNEDSWQLATKYGQPDLIVKSPEYVMPAVAQDAWWRPSVPTGLTEQRWVKAIEIRPVGKGARKITHHALARLVQPEDMDPALFTNDPNVAGDGLFMEWAVGKNGDEMRPDSGRLMLPNSKIVSTSRYGEAGPGPKGTVMTVAFELDGLSFTALNGGPQYKFTEALSLVVHCETQTEVDHYWSKLSAGGNEVACGWLKDKYGLAWQIVPNALIELIQDKDPAKSQRVMAAMLQMKKIDIAGLQAAHAAA